MLNSSSVSLSIQTGISVGVCIGAITTCILFVMGIIVVKVLMIHRERRKGNF